jgi:hypothetical protein
VREHLEDFYGKEWARIQEEGRMEWEQAAMDAEAASNKDEQMEVASF